MNIQQILLIVGLSLVIIPIIQLSSSLLMSKRERNLFDDMCSREFNEWVTLDANNHTTYPTEGTNVLTYIPAWSDYEVAHVIWSEGSPSKAIWCMDSGMLNEKSLPLCWQYINEDHDKTKNNP